MYSQGNANAKKTDVVSDPIETDLA